MQPMNVISVEGYKAFRGYLEIKFVAGPRSIFGDWLYRPDTDCWYGGGRSYPANLCKIGGFENGNS